MAASVDNNALVKTIVDQLGSQVGLSTTLSTAICGGLVALVIQISIHNATGGTSKIALSYPNLIPVALALQVASILLGYFARGVITDIVPILMQLPPDTWQKAGAGGLQPLTFGAANFSGAASLYWFVLLQFVTMFIGLISIIAFACVNMKVFLS
jgi:hypothetical protein